jgi:hypothetical protein
LIGYFHSQLPSYFIEKASLFFSLHLCLLFAQKGLSIISKLFFALLKLFTNNIFHLCFALIAVPTKKNPSLMLPLAQQSV